MSDLGLALRRIGGRGLRGGGVFGVDRESAGEQAARVRCFILQFFTVASRSSGDQSFRPG